MSRFPRTAGLVKQAVAEGCAPCAAIAVGVREQLLVKLVCGNARTMGGMVPAGEDTRYDMASLTKLLVPTMIALKLLEEGRLTLRDTLEDWFGALVPPQRRAVTVFRLMTHTGGIPPTYIPAGRVPRRTGGRPGGHFPLPARLSAGGAGLLLLPGVHRLGQAAGAGRRRAPGSAGAAVCV